MSSRRAFLLALLLALAAGGPRASFAAEANDNPLSITTSTTTDGRVCSVGPYGWFCDPPAVENDVTYYTPQEFEGFDPIIREGSYVGAIPEGLPPLCVDECVEDCRPPCPPECVATKFNLRSEALVTGAAGVYVSHQFFVNPYNGDDANPGTRERPWETLKRAEAQVRFLRVQNTEAPDSTKLQEPVQTDPKLRPRAAGEHRGPAGELAIHGIYHNRVSVGVTASEFEGSIASIANRSPSL